MQIRFNDGATLAVQKVTEIGDGLQVLVAGTTPEKLRELFTDPVKTTKMTAGITVIRRMTASRWDQCLRTTGTKKMGSGII